MNRIQQVFEFIAAISQQERDRWALAQAIYGVPRRDVYALQTPACWRRKANVQRTKR